jgi:hypothetical protein
MIRQLRKYKFCSDCYPYMALMAEYTRTQATRPQA